MAEAIGLLILTAVEAGGVEGAAAFGSTAIVGSFTVATAVGTTALLGASIALAYATASGPDVPKPSDGAQPLRQAIPPRPCGYGRARIAGSYMLFDNEPQVAGYSLDVLAMHQGRIAGFVSYYLGDDIVLLNASGIVTNVVNVVSGDVRYTSPPSGIITIKTRLGLDTETAYSEVISPLPGKWTTAHRGDSIASLMLACGPSTDVPFYTKHFPRGLPHPSVAADLSPIYDPRAGDQVRSDPDTWGLVTVTGAANNGAGLVRLTVSSTALLRNDAVYVEGIVGTTVANGSHMATVIDATHVDLDVTYSGAYVSGGEIRIASRNPVLQLLDYLTQDNRGGPQIDWDTVIAPVLDDLMAEADLCDALVTKADGSTERRYESSGWYYLTSDPAEVYAAMIATCDGWMCEGGDGTLRLKIGSYRAPTVTLTDEHILGFAIDKGVGDEDIVNELRFSYAAEANHYREAPGQPWRDETSIAELGKVRSQTLPLTWVHSHSQGRRLAKRVMARHQATARGMLKTSLYGRKLLGERWVAVQSSLIADLTDAVVEILPSPHIDLAAGTVTFNWVMVNPNAIDAWDAATEEGLAPNFFPVPGTAGTTPAFAISDNGGATHKIKVAFSDPSQQWLEYAVEWRIGSSGPWTRQSFYQSGYGTVAGTGLTMTAFTNPGTGTITLVTDAVTPGTYNVRVAAIGPQGPAALGNWTSLAGTSVVIA